MHPTCSVPCVLCSVWSLSILTVCLYVHGLRCILRLTPPSLESQHCSVPSLAPIFNVWDGRWRAARRWPAVGRLLARRGHDLPLLPCFRKLAGTRASASKVRCKTRLTYLMFQYVWMGWACRSRLMEQPGAISFGSTHVDSHHVPTEPCHPILSISALRSVSRSCLCS